MSDAVTTEAIPVDDSVWSRSDLIARIIERHMVLGAELGGRHPAWTVAPRDGEDIHDAVRAANRHLERLDWVLILTPDEPWAVHAAPAPTRQFPSPGFVAVFWSFAVLSTMLAGAAWIRKVQPEGGWLTGNELLDALTFYTLPLLGGVALASFIQQQVGRHHGIRVGHILPVLAVPLPFWPFGLMALPSWPRMDARPWPNRLVMASVSLAAPVTLILTGLVLFVIGLILTPLPSESAYALLDPVRVGAPWWMPFGIAPGSVGLTRLSLLHPIGLAGFGLSFFGWLSLLPIPTFPGGRVIVARMGKHEARSTSVQVMLLLGAIIFTFLYDGLAGNWTWLVIGSLAMALIIANGSDTTLPLVVDDFVPLNEQEHRRVGLTVLFGLILALPGAIPFAIDETWDSSMEVTFDAITEDPNWMESYGVTLTSRSLVDVAWSVDISLEAPIEWNGTLQCGAASEPISVGSGCNGTLHPYDTIRVEVWSPNSSAGAAALQWDVSHTIEGVTYDRMESMAIPNSGLVRTSNVTWARADESLCATFDADTPQNLSLGHETSEHVEWRFTGLAEPLLVIDGPEQVCVRPSVPLDLALAMGMGPGLVIPDQNTTRIHLNLPALTPSALIPPEGWHIGSEENLSGGVMPWLLPIDPLGLLLVADDGEGSCSDAQARIPLHLPDPVTEWYLGLAEGNNPRLVPDLNGTNATVRFTADADGMIGCGNTSMTPELELGLIEGPDIVLGLNGVRTRAWIDTISWWSGPDASGNLSFSMHHLGGSNTSFNIEYQGDATGVWSVPSEIPDRLITNASISIPITVAEPASLHAVWVTWEDGVVLNLGAWAAS